MRFFSALFRERLSPPPAELASMQLDEEDERQASFFRNFRGRRTEVQLHCKYVHGGMLRIMRIGIHLDPDKPIEHPWPYLAKKPGAVVMQHVPTAVKLGGPRLVHELTDPVIVPSLTHHTAWAFIQQVTDTWDAKLDEAEGTYVAPPPRSLPSPAEGIPVEAVVLPPAAKFRNRQVKGDVIHRGEISFLGLELRTMTDKEPFKQYCVDLEADNGTDRVWGADLERALRLAGAEVGDLIECIDGGIVDAGKNADGTERTKRLWTCNIIRKK